MDTKNTYIAVVDTAKQRLACARTIGREHLDIGAGRAELILALQQDLPMRSTACDFDVERFAVKDLPRAAIDLNREPLPYPNAHFDLVTSSDVVERVDNYRAFLREAFRVTASGGVLVIATPNVLNIHSRLRYFISGFANLFGPLSLTNDSPFSAEGHITPIPYFYLAHALQDAGFDQIELSIDQVQKQSLLWLVLLAPFIYIGKRRFMARVNKKLKSITSNTEPLFASHFSWLLLIGKTVIVSAIKSVGASLERDDVVL